MDTSLLPVSEILKLLISEIKKMMEFKDLLETLASTMERQAPVIMQMAEVQKRLEPDNNELDVLTKAMERAIELVRECPRVRGYDMANKRRYTKEMKAINESILIFCQRDIPLLERRDSLLRRLKETQRISFDENEQRFLLESFKGNVKGKQVQVNHQYAAALHGSQDLSLHEADQETHPNIQESIFLSLQEEQVAKRRARELLDEQIAFGLRYTETKMITNGSSSSTNAPLYKYEQLDQQFAAVALHESLNTKEFALHEADDQVNDSAMQEAILLSHQEEQAAKRRARELLDEQIAFGFSYEET